MATKKKAAKKAAKKPAKKAAKKVAKNAAKKKPAKKAAKKKPAKKKSARKPNAAFMKAMTPSAALAAVVGAKPLARTEAVKKIWGYIKANKLQDNKNRRMVNTDAKLKAVFGNKGQVSMFEIAKYLGKNLS
jgi:chromatin remodeling complex protein RSC6